MKNVFKINRASLFVFMAYFLVAYCLLSSYPFILSQFLPLPNGVYVTIGIICVLTVLLLLKNRLRTFIPAFNTIVIIQIVTWIFFFLYHADSSYFIRVVLIAAAYVSLLAIQNCNGGLLRFAQLYNNAILLMAVGGILCFFLVLLFSFQPFFEFQNPDERSAYFFGLTSTNFYIGNVIRYAGFFDEPGAMAYWGVFALLFNRLFIRNSIYEKILIICLVFTFSLAFYIQLALYFLMMKRLTLKQYGIIAITMFVLFNFLSDLEDSEYSHIYDITISRIEYSESDRTIEGDNRSELASTARKYFKTAPIMGHSARKMGVLEGAGYSDNPYEILAKDGILGFIVTYIPLLFVIFFSRGNRDFLIGAFILAVGYIQRPFHVNYIHWLMLYMFVLLCFTKESNFQDKNTINKRKLYISCPN